MRRRSFLAAAGLLAAPAIAAAQGRAAPPHEWVFGLWFGGQFPPGDVQGQACSGHATVIFLRDVVMRASLLEVAYRQRLIETVSATPDGLEFRLVPLAPAGGGMGGGRLPPDIGFSCDGNPDLLRVRRIGPHEIVLPGCTEFPAVLRRCIPD